MMTSISQLFTSHIFKIFFSATIISIASSLAQKNPRMAGLIIALPLTSMISMFLNYSEFKDTNTSVIFAKSILQSVPLSLTFFIPFLFADLLKLPYWGLYLLGVGTLSTSYFLFLYYNMK